jgi:hypothetical protein
VTRPEHRDERLIVRVRDQVDERLTGQPGREYESPPQTREEAIALAELLLERPLTNEAEERWSRPLAGGRRTVSLDPVDTPNGGRR